MLVHFRSARRSLDLGVAFMEYLDPGEARAFLEARAEHYERGLEYLAAHEKKPWRIRTSPPALEEYVVTPGDMLLTIRGSDIAFVMAVKGPLLEAARAYEGGIEVFAL